MPRATERTERNTEVEYRSILADASAAEYSAYNALIQRAVSVFGDATTASRWLSTPNAAFNGEVPLHVAQDEGYSLASFEPVFARIEHGIYV